MESERAEDVAGLPRKRMGAGALFVDDVDRVLLVEPTYMGYWELPGGVVEADESPYAAVIPGSLSEPFPAVRNSAAT
ncbi:NUDIX hydrolase [Nocardia vinacea]|uniref:NUDIX hydrolase n=1 Tax=Nocardia vinacea TaxID=96468 RepID=UPI0033FC06FB